MLVLISILLPSHTCAGCCQGATPRHRCPLCFTCQHAGLFPLSPSPMLPPRHTLPCTDISTWCAPLLDPLWATLQEERNNCDLSVQSLTGTITPSVNVTYFSPHFFLSVLTDSWRVQRSRTVIQQAQHALSGPSGRPLLCPLRAAPHPGPAAAAAAAPLLPIPPRWLPQGWPQ